ncbi:unnamed protein product [Hermetia illucens]|uniref:O-acyltransferase WSD1 C-terminal domain-containing protein n=2 Tax=Hermetia illucens TaxID=343691 RepID=A0A7R8UDL4_HERIL|nr:uncharacterized protein LOC119656712 isoform X1 [Hermetia illucens]CAD7078830.1 unnamed protein product [Hermetia illucens]
MQLVPILAVSYLCVQTANLSFLKFLSLKYPQYEFSRTKKIRTLIETTRNPGIFSYLLKIDGICDFEKICEYYNTHLIDKRNKSGELRFPKLRRKLLSCWGHYAWMKDDSEFRAEQHIILSPSTYRRRPINENNIQSYVSDIISKHIPFDIPPWQVLIIPTNPGIVGESEIQTPASSPQPQIVQEIPQDNVDYYYILVRVHHLILAEEEELKPNDLLLIKPSSKTVEIFEPPAATTSNLIGFLKKPKHIPNLWTHITMSASNRWNEFIYHYDPLESPDVDKKQPINCFSQLLSILFITTFTVCSDFIREYNKIKNHPQYKIKFLFNLIRRESHKRNLNRKALTDSILYSFNPMNILKFLMALFWQIIFTVIFLSPYYIYREFLATRDILAIGRTKHTSTVISVLAVYLPLIYFAVKELLDIISEVAKAPRFVYEELFESPTRESNVLQVKSYRGRRVVSISKPIDMEILRNRVTIDEYIESEFLYSCLAAALKKFLSGYENFEVPSMINVTSRSFEKGYFLTKDNKYDHISGVVFHQLPLAEPNLNQLKAIREITERIRRKQIAIFLVSLGQTRNDFITKMLPEVILKVLINHFSINFPITITEIHGDFTNAQTVWGQSLQDLLCFRPQQSKTCLSLNIHITGSKCRLAVMADSQLAPNHIKISEAWTHYMESTTL